MDEIFKNEYAGRMRKLMSLLPESVDGVKIDGAVISSEISRRYLTGFPATDGFVFLNREKAVFITDSRYTEAAENSITNCEVRGYKKLSETAKELAAELKMENVLIETQRVTLAEAKNLDSTFAPLKLIKTPELDTILDNMRARKSEYEIGKMKQAQKLTEDALRYVLDNVLDEGVSEKQLALEIEFYMRRHGAERVAFDLIVAAGANSSMPHAVPSDYTVRNGDFITFDIGAVVDGYHSDMTRTVAFGSVSDEQRLIYNTVLRAQKAAQEYLLSGGKTAKEYDAAARKVISDAGYGAYFGHSTGHGVGVEIHEKPFGGQTSKDSIPTGAVITDEPGIYLAGKFGVRIEDMLYKTESSCENLTGFEKDLLVITKHK